MAVLQELKELRSHLDITGAAGIRASRADHYEIGATESEETGPMRYHASIANKPSSSQRVSGSRHQATSPKNIVIVPNRDPKTSKSLMTRAAPSPARTPRRGLWGAERRDQRQPAGRAEGGTLSIPSSPQASSVSFQDMLQQHRPTGEDIVTKINCMDLLCCQFPPGISQLDSI